MKNKKIIERQGRTVLMVSHYYGGHGGGIESVASKLAEEIADHGEFHFIWAASDLEPRPERVSHTWLPMRAVNFLESLLGLPWPIWGPGSLKHLRQAVLRADIVWLHDTLYMGNMLAFYWARRFGKPIVITQHIGAVPYRNPLFRKLMQAADRLVTIPMLKKAAQTIFISDCVAEDYYARVGFKSPVKVIPNGVDQRLYYVPPKEKRRYLREQFALKASQPVLLFVGRFVEKKGLAVLRQLASLLPEWRFWLAGKGPIDPAKWLLPNVHVFRDRSGATLAELYHAADLLVLPSYGEGFPLVIQEAMSCGLPVACSPKTAAGSFLAKPLLVLAEVWPGDPQKTAVLWANKLKKLPLPLKKPSPELAEFAQINWEWSLVAQAYIDVFRGLLTKA